MGTLFALLIGMLVCGAGTALGIMAYDRARERDHALHTAVDHQGHAMRASAPAQPWHSVRRARGGAVDGDPALLA